jgi:UDP-GlcNAc:undecaprenyl-phosphate GlcNAc-1-phosphate transferase
MPQIAAGFHEQLLGLFLATTLMLTLGIIDDVWKLDYRIKFAVQIISALILYGFGFRMDRITDPFRMSWIPLGVLSLPVTVFWHLLVMNAVNLIDGLDGLAAGISIIALGVILAVTQIDPAPTNLVSVALMGALIGFLPFNFYPAKIFLGDAGSQMLGQFLSAITLASAMKLSLAITLTVPIAVLMIPTINVILIALVRLGRAKNPFQSQTGFHLHYKLIRVGFTHRESVLILYLVSLFFGGIALWSIQQGNPAVASWLTLASVLFVVSFYFGIDRFRKP